MKRPYVPTLALLVACAFLLLGCASEEQPGPSGDGDAGQDTGGRADTGRPDTGMVDTGGQDTGANDTGVTDTSITDTGADLAFDTQEDTTVTDTGDDAAEDVTADTTGDTTGDTTTDTTGDAATSDAPTLSSFSAQRSSIDDYHLLYFEGSDANEDLASFSIEVLDGTGNPLTDSGGDPIVVTREPDDFYTQVEDLGSGAFRGQSIIYWSAGSDPFIGSYRITAKDETELTSAPLTASVEDAGGDADSCVLPHQGDALPCAAGLDCEDGGDGWNGTCAAATGGTPVLSSATLASIVADDSDCVDAFGTDLPHAVTWTLAGTNSEAIVGFWVDGISFSLPTADDPTDFSFDTVDVCFSDALLAEVHYGNVWDAASRFSDALRLDIPVTEVGDAATCGGFDGDDKPIVCEPGLFCADGTCAAAGTCPTEADPDQAPIELNDFLVSEESWIWRHADGLVFPGERGVDFNGAFEPSCAASVTDDGSTVTGGQTGGEVVYFFQAPVEGTYRVTTRLPGFDVYGDTELTLWDLCDPVEGTEYACSEDVEYDFIDYYSQFDIDLFANTYVVLEVEPWDNDGNGQPYALAAGLLVEDVADGEPCHAPFINCDEDAGLACIYDGDPPVGTCGAAGDVPTVTDVTHTLDLGYTTVEADPYCPGLGVGEIVDVLTVTITGTADTTVSYVWFEHPNFFPDWVPVASGGTPDVEGDVTVESYLCFDPEDTPYLDDGNPVRFSLLDDFGEIGYVTDLYPVNGPDDVTVTWGRLSSNVGEEDVTVE